VTTLDGADARTRIRHLLRELDATPAGRELLSPAARRQRAAEVLLGSPDPVLREIGEQVRDGRIRLADAIRIPAYAEAFSNAARQAAGRIDPERIAEQLEQFVAHQRGSR
jgi:hypothetical protein